MAKQKFVFSNNDEPSYVGEDSASSIEVIKALNWYNENRTEKDAAKILNCELRVAKNHQTFAWLTQMKKRGFVFNESNSSTVAEMQKQYQSSISKTVEVQLEGEEVSAISMQERIAKRTNYLISELEGVVDDYGHTLKSKDFKAYDWFLKNEVKPIHAGKIADWFRQSADEIIDGLKDPDKDYREAYTRIGKDKIKSILAVMENIISDAERLAQNVSKTRKPRKKKPVSFDKMVSKLQYKPKDDNFKIQSINPVNMIGASQVWIFNTKSRKLGVYSALDSVGILVKGTKLENYSINESFAKTLRKPEKSLNIVLDGGKIALRKLMDSINSKPASLNGKIGKDVVILRVLK
jgi:hypothetical protein